MLSMRSRRVISGLLLGMLLLESFITAGCSRLEKKQHAGNQGAANTITIAGSTSVQPFSEVLAEKYMQKNKNVQINVQGGGSSQGIEAALSGAANIGSSSRDLKPAEKAKNLHEIKMALDGVAIITHPDNKVAALTLEQVKNIYLGNVKNWKEIGGQDAPITVVSREDGSGTREAFSDIVMNKENITNHAIIQNSNGAIRTTVAGDKNAIGFVSLAIVNDQVKAVTIDGAEPTAANVQAGTYKISRPFLYLTVEQPTGIVKDFIDFVLSPEGQKIIVDEGAISINS